MSSILKALKKLEDENSIRKPDSLKIDAEILRGDTSRHFSPMTITLLAALLFVCGSGATYILIKPDTVNFSETKSTASSVAPSGLPSSATNIAPVAEKQHNQNLRAELPKPDKVISVRIDNKLHHPPPSSQKQPELLSKTQPVQPIKQSDLKQPIVPIQKTPAPVIRQTAPPLKVNGIAFQEENADRVAIVNGVSVSNGSMIEGARVEDIQKDRVRFSYGGEKFDVALGKSNR